MEKETVNRFSGLDIQELNNFELYNANGGGFAYDAGFFFRELWVYASNGGGPGGTIAAAIDLGINYRPVN